MPERQASAVGSADHNEVRCLSSGDGRDGAACHSWNESVVHLTPVVRVRRHEIPKATHDGPDAPVDLLKQLWRARGRVHRFL